MTDWSPPLTDPPENQSPEILPTGPYTSGPRPLDGNRAALLLLVTQNVVTGVLMAWAKLPLGLSLLLSFVATALLALVLLRPALGRLVQDVRWKTPPAVWTALGALVLGVIASRGILVFVQSVYPQSLSKIPQFPTTGWDRWALLLAGGLLIPFAEEVAFRGLLTRGYERARGPLFAALASSLLFGLAHGVPAQIAAIWPIAWVLARSVQHSGSFWTGVVVHALNNGLSLLLAILLSGTKLMADAQKQLQLADLQALPIQLGLAGLLVAAAAMFVATVWLKPRGDLPAPVGGPVLSGSLAVLAALIVLVIVGQFVPLGTLIGR
ncbi:CPBP family intramembrane glutamic endopeptidase [Deinococcus altitudinis]|uniref:CPBP family intramembrane glutamic endopeptidase n=1 Tax=Deinococcus altitudinis TaxID=468914 RepID=UPI003891BC02